MSNIANNKLSTRYLRSFSYLIFAGFFVLSMYLFFENKKLKVDLEKLDHSYKRFFSHQILDLFDKNSITDVAFGDHKLMDMTILFADVRNFSTIVEKIGPHESYNLVNELFPIMHKAVFDNRGIVDKHTGDGLMALFPSGADDALNAALKMVAGFEKYNKERVKQGKKKIRIGIGMDAGQVVIGTVGSLVKMEQTVVADTVNVASRIEQLTKAYRTNLLISKNVYNRLQKSSKFAMRKIDVVKVKGRNGLVSLLEVLNAKDTKHVDLYMQTQDIFSSGVKFFKQGDKKKAKETFQQVLVKNPNDIVAKIYIDRCDNK